MNKIDLKIINNLKIENKDVLNINLDIITLLYDLYKNNFIYDPNDFHYINKDKIIVSKSIEKLYEQVMNIFYKTKETYEYLNNPNIFGTSLGLLIGNRYLDNLIKSEESKCNLITNHIYCICKYDELLSDRAFDSIFYVNNEHLNKMIYIVIKDNYDICKEDLVDRFSFLKFNIEEVNGLTKLNNILEDAKSSKLPTIIFVNLKTTKEIPKIKEEVDINELHTIILKRLSKHLDRWQNNLKIAIKNLKIKEISEFLNTKKVQINFKGENIKLNNDYEEKILQSNQKIFNILANKNSYILNLADTTNIIMLNKVQNMTKNNPTARNLILPHQITLLSDIACGLGYLGFKVFINTYLDNLPKIYHHISCCSKDNLNVHFTFLEDKQSINLIDTLNFIPNLITFRPCDINEVIGVYEVLKEYNKTTAIITSLEKVKEIKGTNFKYVQAGCYPVKKESDIANGIIIASGYNVTKAVNVSNSLLPLGIVLRVLSLPALKVFDMQTIKYKNILIPETKVFVLDQNNSANYKMFVKNSEYILTEELEDGIKAKIIELMKK